MVTLDQLVELVRDEINADPTRDDNAGYAEAEAFARATIKHLGLVVSERTGEVYDPQPKQTINYPEQQNVHYRGGSRRRGYKR